MTCGIKFSQHFDFNAGEMLEREESSFRKRDNDEQTSGAGFSPARPDDVARAIVLRVDPNSVVLS
jgi:hypothetical protein